MSAKDSAEVILKKANADKKKLAKRALVGKRKYVNQLMKTSSKATDELYKQALELQEELDGDGMGGDSKPCDGPPAPSKKPRTNTEDRLHLQWNERFNQLIKLPVKDLCALLTSLEPTALSPMNIRGLSKHGNLAVSKTSLCEVIEFVTGVLRDHELPTGAYATLNDLAVELQGYSLARGRPAQSLVMPPDWPNVGCYQIQHAGGDIFVWSRFKNLTVQFELGDYGYTEGLPITIKDNHSERSAYIFQSGVLKPVTAVELFGDASKAVQRTPPTNRRTAQPAQSGRKGLPIPLALPPVPDMTAAECALATGREDGLSGAPRVYAAVPGRVRLVPQVAAAVSTYHRSLSAGSDVSQGSQSSLKALLNDYLPDDCVPDDEEEESEENDEESDDLPPPPPQA